MGEGTAEVGARPMRVGFVCTAKEAERHPARNGEPAGSEQLKTITCFCFKFTIVTGFKKWYELGRVVRKL